MTREITVGNSYNNPEKYFMKWLCRILYFCGLGNCWYEENKKSTAMSYLYSVWAIISNVYIITVMLDEALALFRSDLTVNERNDLIQSVIAHSTLYLKFIVLILQRRKIKIFFEKMFEDTRAYTCSDLEEHATKKAKLFTFILYVTMMLAILTFTIDGFRVHYKTGKPARTLVTYWPKDSDEGLFLDVARVFIQLHWWYIVTIMVVVDSVCCTSIVFLAYKFKALCRYYKDLGDIVYKNDEKTAEVLEGDMLTGFVTGIQLLDDALWCAQSLKNSLGPIYSIQTVQSVGLLGICLIKFVKLERSLSFLLANFAYIQCMLALTTIYMTAAGDVTYEASYLPNAIFYCGWEQYGRTTTMFRPLVTMTLLRSQVPVVMTAFGIFSLSYATLISILRASYSMFAVMY